MLSEKKKASNKKYADKLDQIKYTVHAGTKKKYQSHVKIMSYFRKNPTLSLNAFITQAVEEKIARDIQDMGYADYQEALALLAEAESTSIFTDECKREAPADNS